MERGTIILALLVLAAYLAGVRFPSIGQRVLGAVGV